VLCVEAEATNIRQRARSFGAAAQLYEQARPSYPAQLFAHIAAALPGPRVLEVGAGTGKATVGLAALGLELTCIEPDPKMAAVLARRAEAGLPIRVEVESFESFTASGTYDALVSATAWHWTEPATRMDRAAALLRPGGFLGLCWNTGMLRQEPAVNAIQAIYDEFALFGRDRPGEPAWTPADLAVVQDPATWPGDEIAAHPGFEYLGASLFPWQQDLTAAECAALLESTSYYQVLDPQVRARLVAAVIAVIRDRFDDLVTIAWSTQCYNARRLG
jgi:SAM-dependent methyltransferase